MAVTAAILHQAAMATAVTVMADIAAAAHRNARQVIMNVMETNPTIAPAVSGLITNTVHTVAALLRADAKTVPAAEVQAVMKARLNANTEITNVKTAILTNVLL